MVRLAVALAFILSLCVAGQRASAQNKVGKLPHVEFDVDKKQVRVECEAINIKAALEFFCCVTGTQEHESALRTAAKPSDIQIGLLAIGLKPGQPITYHEATNSWTAPQGPPLQLSVEYEKDGKTVTYPAYRWLRGATSKKEAPPFTWVFTGSRVMNDGKFAADVMGYVVSLANVDLTLIDVPELKSRAWENLDWVLNTDLAPKTGTKVWMIIEPAPKDAKGAKPADNKPAPQSPKAQSAGAPQETVAVAAAPGRELPANLLSDVHRDARRVPPLKDYLDMTTPRPENGGS